MSSRLRTFCNSLKSTSLETCHGRATANVVKSNTEIKCIYLVPFQRHNLKRQTMKSTFKFTHIDVIPSSLVTRLLMLRADPAYANTIIQRS